MVEVEEMDVAQVAELKMKARLKPVHEATIRFNSPVQKFYENKTIFITGGTGFLGKQLIEKLLRATKIAKIFILVRTKKGKAIEERLQDMLKDPVFDLAKEACPEYLSKLVLVPGDVSELKLGISDKDWKTVAEETEIIFHLAATTRFDDPLRVATFINVRGAREALILGKDCKNLKSFVHVSTAYSNACASMIDNEVNEQFYKSPMDPEVLIRMAETMDDERIQNITPSLIKDWPNTYSFAKAVAEQTVTQYAADLPLCVVRPAIVVAAALEPGPGWIDISNVFGASAIIVGPGLGLVRVIYASHDAKVGLIPVDYVNNSIITAAWETAKNKEDGELKTKIYNVAPSRNPPLWGNLSEIFTSFRFIYAAPQSIWYNFAWQTTNNFLFFVYSWFLHLIPAYLIDGICLILGKERRFVKLYKKVYKMSKALSYFTTHNWRFVDGNTEALYNGLSEVDKVIFDFDVMTIDWREYMLKWIIGLRKYVIKDGLKGSKYGARKQFIFLFVNIFASILYFYALLKLVLFAFYVVSSIFSLVLYPFN
ncbi:fatty acyl-CoA reductase wat-like [Trichoplusia ni]|uniref:Fatty acyl-CoA reductase n=1 Tax=Trichoplusia ni TaxID=7111 RepID=A0A7E5WH45_TRINI|nr:fatty acyl-CoA reductase wat-like [Trichoplusia ni]